MMGLSIKKSAGFTLIEVMIALVIIAIAFIAVMMTLRQTIWIQQKLPNKMISHVIAMNALASMQLHITDVPSSTPEVKNISMAGSHWKWQADLISKHRGIEYISVKVYKQQVSAYILQDVLYGYVRKKDK